MTTGSCRGDLQAVKMLKSDSMDADTLKAFVNGALSTTLGSSC